MKTIFGPVPSRRLGLSLGIDLVPHKTCTLDCLYCECGPTTLHTFERKEYVDSELILDELRRVIRSNISFDWVTFSGSGEPLLNSKFGYIARSVRKIVGDRTALLTNSTLLPIPEVRKEAGEVTWILPSLDTARNETFIKLNRPVVNIDVKEIIESLRAFKKEYPKVTMSLEILFVKGFNDTEEELLELKRAIHYIEPDEVHLNTVVRPPSYRVSPVSYEFLVSVRDFFALENVKIIGVFEGSGGIDSFMEETLCEALKRRPLTLEDMERIVGDKKKVEEILKRLILVGRIEELYHDGKVFYKLVS